MPPIEVALFVLDLNVKPVLAARAHYRVLSLLLWKTKIVAAGRTFFVNVSLSVTHLAFL